MVDRRKTLVVDGGAARIAELEAENERLERERDKWEQHACTGDDVLARTRVKLAAAESALASERAAHAETNKLLAGVRDDAMHADNELCAMEARIAELEAEIERLRNMLNGYGKLDAELAIAERRIETLSRTGAVKVKALEWSGPFKPRENGIPYDHIYADSPLGRYAFSWKGWKENDTPVSENCPGDFFYCASDLDDAKAAAQADYERRILSALVLPAAPQPKGDA